MKKVLIITRLTTQNAGNEALSRELIRFLNRQPGTQVRALDRYPMYLEHMTLRTLGDDPSRLTGNFLGLVQRLREQFISPDAELAPLASEQLVQLKEDPRELPLWIRRIKRKIGYRRNLAAFGIVGRPEALQAFNSIAWADLLLWNPAGEFHPTGDANQAFRLLLLVALAQELGVRTAIVNHSLEIASDTLRSLVAFVYQRADFVGLREQPSVDYALNLGISPGKVHLVPDLVFLASTFTVGPARELSGLRQGAIGFAINGLEAFKGHDEWPRLFEKLKGTGRQFLFVSNAMNHDLAFARAMAGRYGGMVVERQPNYLELRAIMANLGVVVSSRLHSSILALCEGTPVVSLEPSVFKLTGIFDSLRYPIPTKNVAEAGWADSIFSNAVRALDRREEYQVFTRDRLAEQVRRIETLYSPLFE